MLNGCPAKLSPCIVPKIEVDEDLQEEVVNVTLSLAQAKESECFLVLVCVQQSSFEILLWGGIVII